MLYNKISINKKKHKWCT